ncbi:two-component system OmpR family sensor kinase [Curtobacterium sp. PhB142]|uniref:sensor histidine kinase n=1 Tax=unclassified Curtobacterium TaxID=257496 RepID=UPI000F467FA7|nr:MULTISPECIES: HAMP domain-containing sensor histidine kinase [unclassified Curtobacterium]ROS47550.1 two-component system OmpR family sensor kinase [Curtobacterium sp. PhB78]TCL86876.1 two-component system OmpR family sensor kinase [Curtobacterium sp. PhB142]TCM03221.1 two-component system OmpR family sensor kinase [Curtobacterium sp. PhB134]
MTLRRRLVLSIVALVVAVSAVIGAASIIALSSIQTNAIDKQITGATHRAQRYLQQNESGQPGIDLTRLSGQAAGTLTAYFVDGQVVIANVLDEYGRPGGITQSSVAALGTVRVGADPTTVDLGSGIGRYRITAVDVGPAVLVVGLPMASVYDSVWKLFWVVVIVVGTALLAASIVAAVVVRRSLRPLERVAETASTVARMPLDRSDALDGVRVPDTDPRTEVGRVGSAFNRMLGHIGSAMQARERSEQKVRQFVADASHELRTPLASVRGYAELTRRMGGDLPKDVVYAMSRIESESIRMTSMVEDLLLLARLDEGREIQFDEVDLTGLVLDAVNDAHAASPEHVIEIDVPSSPVVVVGDAARLHQVIVNLVTNARTHTPEGTRITVGLAPSPSGPGVDLTVRDTGQGIDPEFLPKLFERFARADSSRSRTVGSTGLGLAIVDAVVQAHGGSVEVASVPGDTVFTVHLPVDPSAAAESESAASAAAAVSADWSGTPAAVDATH